MSRRRRTELVLFIIGCLVFGYFLIPSSQASDRKEGRSTESLTPESSAVAAAAAEQEKDFSRFKHANPMHARLPCLLCHKRDDNSPVPNRSSGHLPCAGCHVQQFADNQHPICTICHTATGVKRFPPLRSFNVQFDHAKHLRQTNCTTCHRPSRNGVGLSVPASLNAHTTCFQCHGPNTQIGDRNIGSCGTCHQPGNPTKNSDWARAYQATPFSHARHGGGQNLNCASCHTVKAGAGRGRQVSAPLASMHFAPPQAQSCASCHNNKRTFGGEDFSDCRRCHRGNSFKF